MSEIKTKLPSQTHLSTIIVILEVGTFSDVKVKQMLLCFTLISIFKHCLHLCAFKRP